jgi:hypothetical protein
MPQQQSAARSAELVVRLSLGAVYSDSEGYGVPPAVLAAYCKPKNKNSLGFIAGLDNKNRVLERRAWDCATKSTFA